MDKFILNFTPTGMIPTKEMNQYVPVSPEEIIEEVLEAKKYGVSIVHLHARDKEGKPTWKKEVYQQIIEGIREKDVHDHSSLIICVSTSGRNWPEFEKRSDCLNLTGKAKPDMASLTLSSLNFPHAASTNSPEMIQNLAAKMLEKGIKPELEVFDSGMVNYAKYLFRKGLIHAPFYFNLIFGNIAGMQADLTEAGFLVSQLPENSYWSFGGIGDAQLKMNITSILFGGGIRVGLEDNIYLNKDKKEVVSNIQLLERISKISGLIGIEPYTSNEARQLLKIQPI
jgi:uncharacterized protein (DUF849 family)